MCDMMLRNTAVDELVTIQAYPSVNVGKYLLFVSASWK